LVQERPKERASGLASHSVDETMPDWAPGDAGIAYAAYDGIDYEIYTMTAEGGEKTAVTVNTDEDDEPCWGPAVQ